MQTGTAVIELKEYLKLKAMESAFLEGKVLAIIDDPKIKYGSFKAYLDKDIDEMYNKKFNRMESAALERVAELIKEISDLKKQLKC